MKILLIDDLRNFRSQVKSSGNNITIARNSQEALEILHNDNVWNEIWLDHDLGEVNGKIDTIMPVVDYMCEQAFNGNPVDVRTVFIHTSNPVGRDQIKAAMERYGYSSTIAYATTFFTVNENNE